MTKEQFLTQLDFSKPTVFILRGIPGCGKSSISKEISLLGWEQKKTQSGWASADDYWIQKDGSYKFDLTQVPKNHHHCLKGFIALTLLVAAPVIFLDNTNTTIKEFEHYVKIAEAYNYRVVMVTLNVSVETSKARNVHQVPEKTIQGMYDRLNNPDNVLKVNQFCREHKIQHFNLDTEE